MGVAAGVPGTIEGVADGVSRILEVENLMQMSQVLESSKYTCFLV